MPLAMSGLNEVPDAGDKIYIVKNIRAAEAAAGERRHQERQRDLATEKVTLDNIFSKLQETERTQLPLIVKGDAHATLSAIAKRCDRHVEFATLLGDLSSDAGDTAAACSDNANSNGTHFLKKIGELQAH